MTSDLDGRRPSGTILLTGATGMVGRRLSEHLATRGLRVHGVARHHPAWWMPDCPFTEWDFLGGGVRGLQPAAAAADCILHACDLGKRDLECNKRTARELFEVGREAGVSRFFYFSSVRVQSAAVGEVDENSEAQPWPTDTYGICKWEIERELSNMAYANPRLTILRLGNVFSHETLHKIPEAKDRLTRLLYAGMNTHLISDFNVAHAVGNLLSLDAAAVAGVINVTQELDGENDYFFLADRLAGDKENHPTRHGALATRLRAWMANRRGEGSAGYFNRILERRLRSLGIVYPGRLSEQLTQAKQGRVLGANRG